MTKPINSFAERHWRIWIKAGENHHLCRLSFPRMSSDFKCSEMLSEGGDFPDSFLKSGLLETSQLGLTQAEANVSSPCWKFWLNGCARSTAEQYRRIPSVFLDKYLVYLTTVTSKHKTFSVPCWNRALAVRGGYGWKCRGAGAASVSGDSAAPQGFPCVWVLACLPRHLPSCTSAKLGCILSM